MNHCPKCGAYWECDCEPKESDAEYDARGNFVVQEPAGFTGGIPPWADYGPMMPPVSRWWTGNGYPKQPVFTNNPNVISLAPDTFTAEDYNGDWIH